MRFDASEIPGYREAVERESAVRDLAFLDLTTDICGIKIRKMTALDFLVLDGLGSPFVSGGWPSDFDVVQFLWQLQVRRPWSQVWFAWRCGRLLKGKPVIERINEYVGDRFQDAPGGRRSTRPASVGWLTCLVDALASEYGWPEQSILNMPLDRLFQYVKQIRKRNNPNAIDFNPHDKVTGDRLRTIRARKQLLAVLRERAKQ